MSQPLQVRASYATSPMRSSGLSMQESRAVHHVSLVCVCVCLCVLALHGSHIGAPSSIGRSSADLQQLPRPGEDNCWANPTPRRFSSTCA